MKKHASLFEFFKQSAEKFDEVSRLHTEKKNVFSEKLDEDKF